MTRRNIRTTYDVAVVGGGPAGLAAAALVASCGVNTVLFPGHRTGEAPPDPRTAALMQGTLGVLARLGVWPEPLQACAAPLWRLRLVDETNRAIAAPTVTFDARELGDEPFGWNIPNEALVAALGRIVERSPILDVPSTAPVARVETLADRVALETRDGHAAEARLVIAADGRDSLCRSAAGIKTIERSYRQTAIATTFAHERPHEALSVEHHRPGGPLTTVPMPGNRSSLVWMERQVEARRLMALSAEDFAAALSRAIHGEFGAVSDVGPRRAFPAATIVARQFAVRRVLLVGEAAHVLPPIGAQGLNLGLRDAEAAADLVAETLRAGGDPGDDALLAAYDARRRRDVLPRQLGVDLMNRTLLSGLVPAQAARAAGLFALKSLGPLRRLVMRGGLGPSL